MIFYSIIINDGNDLSFLEDKTKNSIFLKKDYAKSLVQEYIKNLKSMYSQFYISLEIDDSGDTIIVKDGDEVVVRLTIKELQYAF